MIRCTDVMTFGRYSSEIVPPYVNELLKLSLFHNVSRNTFLEFQICILFGKILVFDLKCSMHASRYFIWVLCVLQNLHHYFWSVLSLFPSFHSFSLLLQWSLLSTIFTFQIPITINLCSSHSFLVPLAWPYWKKIFVHSGLWL